MPRAEAATNSAADEIRVTIKPFGPSTEKLMALGLDVMQRAALRKRLGSKARLLYVEAVDDGKQFRPTAPSRFLATIYDASRQCTVLAEGSLDDRRSLSITETAMPPSPSAEEFADAVRLVRRSAEIGPEIKGGALEPYQPIPAMQLEELGDGRFERRITVGLLPRGRGGRHEIVAVDVDRRAVHRFDERAPRPPSPATPRCVECPAQQGRRRHRRAPRARAG